MVELKSKQNFPEVIGSGLLFGSSLLTTNMEHGLLQEKSILWNQEEMTTHMLQEVSTNSDQLFIGDLIGHKINIKRHTKTIPMLLIWIMNSTLMDSFGMKIDFIPIWIPHQI